MSNFAFRLSCAAALVFSLVASGDCADAKTKKAEKPRYQFRRTGKVLFVEDSRTEFERLNAGVEVYFSKSNRQWVVVDHRDHSTKFVGKLKIVKIGEITESTSELMEHLDCECLATYTDKEETFWLMDESAPHGRTDSEVENEVAVVWKESKQRTRK